MVEAERNRDSNSLGYWHRDAGGIKDVYGARRDGAARSSEPSRSGGIKMKKSQRVRRVLKGWRVHKGGMAEGTERQAGGAGLRGSGRKTTKKNQQRSLRFVPPYVPLISRDR